MKIPIKNITIALSKIDRSKREFLFIVQGEQGHIDSFQEGNGNEIAIGLFTAMNANKDVAEVMMSIVAAYVKDNNIDFSKHPMFK